MPTLEGSVQNVELKYCSTSLVKCASGTVGSIKICAKAPGDGGKEKLIPLIQGPSDTRDLHSSKWLNESRKPESLLAPDMVAFTIQSPQYMDYCHNSVKSDNFGNSLETKHLASSILLQCCGFKWTCVIQFIDWQNSSCTGIVKSGIS
ncbi:Vacuolar protein sorting-associated protein 13B [Chelonia mydas]|uniref:Vacuolar protein sorting-associated protein 13B n=1 Tax=Chelonia mydas TaxID=8469 RepID=M7BUA4_CHEMY|nr:Vacuolar protein sorting-associated protein 13B [Chelonia mydas]